MLRSRVLQIAVFAFSFPFDNLTAISNQMISCCFQILNKKFQNRSRTIGMFYYLKQGIFRLKNDLIITFFLNWKIQDV